MLELKPGLKYISGQIPIKYKLQGKHGEGFTTLKFIEDIEILRKTSLHWFLTQCFVFEWHILIVREYLYFLKPFVHKNKQTIWTVTKWDTMNIPRGWWSSCTCVVPPISTEHSGEYGAIFPRFLSLAYRHIIYNICCMIVALCNTSKLFMFMSCCMYLDIMISMYCIFNIFTVWYLFI